MDTRIKHEHIAEEAKKVAAILGRNDNEANWYEAIDNLQIFPRSTYDISNVYNTNNTTVAFGLIRPGLMLGTRRHAANWYFCREVFERDIYTVYNHYHGNYKFGFLFVPSAFEQETRIAHFIRNIELERLTLHELTTFMRVRNKDYIYIRPSSFWTDCRMRFSLFTILIRAGRSYHYNTIEDALMSYPYSRETFAAINLFFQGRRNFTGTILNWRTKWVEHYRNLHESQVKTLSY